MRRLGAVLAAVLVLALAACGDDDGTAGPDADDGTFPAPGPSVASTAPGLIVGQQSVDGRLGDVVVGVDPTTGETIEVPVAAVGLATGVGSGPGRALYRSGDANVLVDLVTASVQDLGLASREHFAPLARSSGGIGQRDDQLSSGTFVTGELRPDESVALIAGQEATYAVPTDDPTAVEQIGDGYGQFLGDGGSVILSSTEGAFVHELATDESRALTEIMTGALPVRPRPAADQ